MLNCYEHPESNHLLILHFSSDISLHDAETAKNFYGVSLHKEDTCILLILDNVNTVDKKFVVEMTKIERHYSHFINSIHIAGLNGVNKFFYMMYLRLSNRKIQRRIFDSILELEEFHHIKLDELDQVNG